MEFITRYQPPQKRLAKAKGGIEEKMTEAAVMLALALHILGNAPRGTVTIHPDGEHAKQLDISSWLEEAGFRKIAKLGRTDYGGRYVRDDAEIVVHPKSGLGDVVGEINGRSIVAECKGGTINSTHSGPLSKLRRGIYEAVGLLMARPIDGTREIVAVPRTAETERIAQRLLARCTTAGIELALVSREGRVDYVTESTG